MDFVVPMPRETIDVASRTARKSACGATQSGGVRLMVTHGNGFAADAYLPFWQHLTPSYDVLVFDFRNHGQNVRSSPPTVTYGSSPAISSVFCTRSMRASARSRPSASSIPCPAAPP
jgi:pimeloyl-ACP methyl ester carboxylesterase